MERVDGSLIEWGGRSGNLIERGRDGTFMNRVTLRCRTLCSKD